jgi:hypothetical protein
VRLAERQGIKDRQEGRPDARETMPEVLLRVHLGARYLYGSAWRSAVESYGRGYEANNYEVSEGESKP